MEKLTGLESRGVHYFHGLPRFMAYIVGTHIKQCFCNVHDAAGKQKRHLKQTVANLDRSDLSSARYMEMGWLSLSASAPLRRRLLTVFLKTEQGATGFCIPPKLSKHLA